MTSRATATLLLSCPDQPGLVAGVANFIHRHKGSILHADQHRDPDTGLFLQRVEWSLAGFALPRARFARAFAPLAAKHGMAWRLSYSDELPRLAILATRQSHCLYDLLARWRMNEWRADVRVVISNHGELAPVAAHFDVPYACLPVTDERRADQEAKIIRILSKHRIGLLVLARYMQILSPGFVARFPERIINIHHSFLPAFAGAKPYHQAHARGVKVIGATAHYVTSDLDQGPIIEQDVARVSHRDSVDDMVRKGRDLEKIVLARAVGLHLARRVVVVGQKTVVFD